MTAVRVSVEGVASQADVVLEIDDGATIAHVIDALADLGVARRSEQFAPRLSVDGQPADERTPVNAAPLVQGSVLSFGASQSPAHAPRDGMHLVVVGGPNAGAWIDLTPGRATVVGRLDGDLRLLDDGLMSREHASFLLEGTNVVVSDQGSSNGTFVEGVRITEPTSIGAGTYVQVGSSTLAVLPVEAGDRAPLSSAHEGSFAFPRSFRSALPPINVEFKLPRAPRDEEGSGSSMWWRSLLPLVSGIGFAIITGNVLFLLLTALAPLVYAVDAFRQRRRRRRSAATRQHEHAEAAAEVTASFTAAAQEERRRSREANPVGGAASVFAATRHRRLWERRPDDADFLSITVGLATRPSTAVLIGQKPDGSDDRSTLPMWGTPVNVDLLSTGSLAVLGEPQRARGVLRSMLIGLGVTHSPSDVRIWLLTDDDAAADWRPMRWLPHIAQPGGMCRIASTREDRSTMLAAVRQVIDGRQEQRRPGDGPPPAPIHVVVVDGASLLSAGDVSDVLVRGPAVGVIGIVVDPSVAPDGVMGTLRLGASADEARFESRLEPLITGVVTAEMPISWAEIGARRLAPLEPAAAGRAELASASERLAKVLDSDATAAGELAARWAQQGPRVKVPVGTVADALFSIDISRDGPHGLVGGMTRSGKTEFLKTLICSLAWANHPDDLCFVIVDFKGGIDYTLAAELPHVLDLSSNQDLAGFERTLRLLSAEQVRRQALFERARVANLDAYRLARADRKLPHVPRLIVLIDEFGELLSTDEGREQLRRIESMSRIGGGLGVNLLLITQNFDGQLPPQIAANAGLRLCFRVQDPSNSRAVLDSSIAATVPAAAKGRGFARLQGGDPVEFQSMRVAGRRPDLAVGHRRVSARLQDFTMLPVPLGGDLVVDVPADETDMSAMISLITDACRAAGWERPAVPWPPVLPTDVPLRSVLPATRPDEVPIGQADVPERQRQVTFAIRRSDEHVALLGGPRADLNTLLVTMACSAAVTAPVDEVHLYGIDFTGRGLARIAGLPHCGGVASRNEALALRIARFLNDEVALRRSDMSGEGVSTLDELQQRTGRTYPHILLLIAGAEKLSTTAGGDNPSAVAPLISTLLAEGSGLGVQVVAAGLAAFGMYRPGSYIDRKIVFETADRGDLLALGCPRSLVGDVRGARRGVDVATQLAVQFCSLAAGDVNEADALDALVQRLSEDATVTQPWRPPVQIREVLWPTRLSTMAPFLADIPSRSSAPLLLGVDGHEGGPFWVDAASTGGAMFVAGGRRSGRSTAALSIGSLAMHLEWDVIGVAGSPNSPLNSDDCPFDVVEASALSARLSSGSGRRLVIIDDVHQLPPDIESDVSSAGMVIATGPTSWFEGVQRLLQNWGLARLTNGIVLMPETSTDLSLVGAKAQAGNSVVRRPGQGLVGLLGDVVELAVPLYE